MTLLRILFVLCFGFFIETAFASKAYDELIQLHNLKIKAKTPEPVIRYNDQIHGILGGSKGFSKKTLTSIEKSNATYIAIHATLTTSGTGEEILLQKVIPSGLGDSINSKIINHYVNLAILYLATKSAESSENPENFKLMIEGGIARLSKSVELPQKLKIGLSTVDEARITSTLKSLNFGEIYRSVKKQIEKRLHHRILENELNGILTPSLEINECRPDDWKCRGGRGDRSRRGHGHHSFGSPSHPHWGPPRPEGLQEHPRPRGGHGHRGHRHHAHPGIPGVEGFPPPPHPHGGPGHHGKKWLKEFSAEKI